MIIFSIFGENNVFFDGELEDYFQFWTVTKNVSHDKTRQQSW